MPTANQVQIIPLVRKERRLTNKKGFIHAGFQGEENQNVTSRLFPTSFMHWQIVPVWICNGARERRVLLLRSSARVSRSPVWKRKPFNLFRALERNGRLDAVKLHMSVSPFLFPFSLSARIYLLISPRNRTRSCLFWRVVQVMEDLSSLLIINPSTCCLSKGVLG